MYKDETALSPAKFEFQCTQSMDVDEESGQIMLDNYSYMFKAWLYVDGAISTKISRAGIFLPVHEILVCTNSILNAHAGIYGDRVYASVYNKHPRGLEV